MAIRAGVRAARAWSSAGKVALGQWADSAAMRVGERLYSSSIAPPSAAPLLVTSGAAWRSIAPCEPRAVGGNGARQAARDVRAALHAAPRETAAPSRGTRSAQGRLGNRTRARCIARVWY